MRLDFEHARGPAPVAALVLSVLIGLAPAAAGETRTGLDVTWTAGYNSNPLELNSGEDGGLFTELELDGELVRQTSPRSELFVRGFGVHREHESGLTDADSTWLDLETGWNFTPYRQGSRQVSLAVGASYGVYRSTYIDPSTGEVFALGLSGAGPGSMKIPRRFDFNSPGALMNLRWRVNDRALAYLNTSLVERSYRENYETSAGLDSLDDRTVSVRPGVRFLAGETVLLDLSVEWSERSYDELPALDRDGDEADDARREYRYLGYRFKVDFQPLERMDLTIGLRGSDRDDTFEGYYDSRTTTLFATADYAVDDRMKLRLHASRRNQDYERATIDRNTDSPVRESRTLRVLGSAERRTTDRLFVVFEAGLERADDREKIYTYDQNWVRAGVRFKL